jgi:hypothetical protein
MSREGASDGDRPFVLMVDSGYFTGPTAAGDTACLAGGVRADAG